MGEFTVDGSDFGSARDLGTSGSIVGVRIVTDEDADPNTVRVELKTGLRAGNTSPVTVAADVTLTLTPAESGGRDDTVLWPESDSVTTGINIPCPGDSQSTSASTGAWTPDTLMTAQAVSGDDVRAYRRATVRILEK